MEALVDAPDADREVLSDLADYMTLREESLQMQVEAFRNQDLELLDREISSGSTPIAWSNNRSRNDVATVARTPA